MTLRHLFLLGAFPLVACGVWTEPTTPRLSSAEQPSLIPAEPAEVEATLKGYAYLPGPSGGATGARFSRFDSGAAVYVGVNGANVRDADGAEDVMTTLPLGTQVTIVAPMGEPVEVINRLNLWYRVRLEDGREGRLFGGLLTPFGGSGFMRAAGEERRWAVTFSPEGKPRLRLDKTPGSDEAITLDLVPSERFKGGRLEAEIVEWGDYDARIQVLLCRLDGGDAPACSGAEARLGDDRQSLEQASPPDPWKYSPTEGPALFSESGTMLAVTLVKGIGEQVMTLQTPQYMRGPDTAVDCYQVGTVRSGSHQGKALVSCVLHEPGKNAPSYATVGMYLRDEAGWTFLSGLSDAQANPNVFAALVEQRIRVAIDASVSTVEGLGKPETLPVANGSITLERRASDHVHGDDVNPLFQVAGVGKVYASDDALVIPHPDGTRLIYRWKPNDVWDGPAPSDHPYFTHTLGCGGYPEKLINVENGVRRADVVPVAKFTDGTVVSRLKDSAHPVNQRLLSWYFTFQDKSAGQRPPGVDFNLTPDTLLASHPWLFIQDPWGRMVRLMREDLQLPAYCEPILYVYADPPTEVAIAPLAPLRFFTTRPHGPHGWKGIAQPDGSIVIDGRRWPRLFWEGRSVWFRPPSEAVVVAENDIAAFLRTALVAQGLRGREVHEFLNAWLPDLEGQGPVRIGFHHPDTIEAIAPLDIQPQPDTLIRVLMDAAATDAPPDWDGTLPAFSQPPQREGIVVVEWGGVTRQ